MTENRSHSVAYRIESSRDFEALELSSTLFTSDKKPNDFDIRRKTLTVMLVESTKANASLRTENNDIMI